MIANAEAFRRSAGSLPWRVLIAIPSGGFGSQLAVMRAWLDQIDRAGWTCAPAGFSGVVNDAVAFYFADRDMARAFVCRFSCGYLAPSRP